MDPVTVNTRSEERNDPMRIHCETHIKTGFVALIQSCEMFHSPVHAYGGRKFHSCGVNGCSLILTSNVGVQDES